MSVQIKEISIPTSLVEMCNPHAIAVYAYLKTCFEQKRPHALFEFFDPSDEKVKEAVHLLINRQYICQAGYLIFMTPIERLK